jgi:hypothetical protein
LQDGFSYFCTGCVGKSDRFDCQRVWSQATDIVYSSSQDGEGDSQGACRLIHQSAMGIQEDSNLSQTNGHFYCF